MIITTNIRLVRIFKLTWKIDLVLVLSCTLAYLCDRFFIRDYFQIPAIIPTVIGTALAFFIGFNNNQAYDRWWEARKIWGTLVNDSRSWARGILSYTMQPQTQALPLEEIRQRMVRRHLGFLYLLKSALRGMDDPTYKKYLSKKELEILERHTNKHNAILQFQTNDLQFLLQHSYIDGFRFLDLNQMVIKFCDEMGKSERIKSTVFPTTYHFFTRLFIWAFAVIVAMVATETTGAWSILLGFIVGFVFHTTHTIGTIQLNPFEYFPTGIPLDHITRNIEINLLQMMGETDVPEPVQPVNREFLL